MIFNKLQAFVILLCLSLVVTQTTVNQCQITERIPLTDQDRAQILDLHNSLRSVVARGNQTALNGQLLPTAANMAQLQWDSELELKAQNWSDVLATNCSFYHNPVRNTSQYKYVGENIYKSWSTYETNLNWTKPVYSWFNEVNNFNVSMVNSFQSQSSPVIGHFTQIIWATTLKIGCSFRKAQNGSKYEIYVVCNYGPGGNYINRPVYIIGAVGSSCQYGTSSIYPGLCLPQSAIPSL